MEPESCIIFKEVQKLRNNLFWALTLYPAILLWYIEIRLILIGKPQGLERIPDFSLTFLWMVLGLFFPIVLCCTKRIIEVRTDGIYTRFMPLNLSFKKIPFYLLEECTIWRYDPLTGKQAEIKEDFLGPGIHRISPFVILQFISGKKMLIHSRKPEELCRAIKQASAQC